MYPGNQSRSEILFDRALAALPGGNSRHTVFYTPHPNYAVRGEGARIYDADGVARIDVINNYSALIHGHNHPKIVEAVIEQARKLLSVSMPTEQEVELAEILCDRLPSVERVRFTNSGTEAVMMAFKAARAFTGRPLIAKMEGAYHGSDDTASVSVAPDPKLWGDPDRPVSVPGPGVTESAAREVLVLPANNVEAARTLLREHADRLAGVVIDPLPSQLLYEPAQAAFVETLREETAKAGALLIFDEVYSFRLGFNGAQGALGARPDLTALGKVIGGGLPIGALGGRADIMEPLFDPRAGRPRLTHGGTFNANPLTMAAGLAAMRLYDRAAFDRMAAIGDRLRRGLAEAARIADAPVSVRGAASLTSVFHADEAFSDYRGLLAASRRNPDARPRADLFFRELLNRGVMIGAAGLFVLSTAIGESELDAVLEAALGAFRALGSARAA